MSVPSQKGKVDLKFNTSPRSQCWGAHSLKDCALPYNFKLEPTPASVCSPVTLIFSRAVCRRDALSPCLVGCCKHHIYKNTDGRELWTIKSEHFLCAMQLIAGLRADAQRDGTYISAHNEFSVQVLIQGSPEHGTQSEIPRPLSLEPVRNVNSLAQPQTYWVRISGAISQVWEAPIYSSTRNECCRCSGGG